MSNWSCFACENCSKEDCFKLNGNEFKVMFYFDKYSYDTPEDEIRFKLIASLATLEKKLYMSRPTLLKVIDTLISKGYIIKIRNDYVQENIYGVLHHIIKPDTFYA